MNIRQTFLKRQVVPAVFDRVAPEQNTYLELASGVPIIDDNGKQSVKISVFTGKSKEGIDLFYYGYLNKDFDKDIYKIVEKAANENINLLMRFERMRKKDSDPNLTIEEATKDMNAGRKNTFKVLTAIYDFNNNSWLHTSNKISDPANDPVEVKTWMETWVLGSAKESVSVDEFYNDNKEANSIVGQPKINSDIDLLTDLFEISNNILSISENAEMLPRIKYIISRVQTNIKGEESVDNTSQEYFEAKKVVLSLIKYYYPITKTILSDNEEFKSWGKSITDSSIEILEKIG